MQTQANTQNNVPAKDYGPMPSVTAKISSIKPEGAVRARCSLNIGGHFIVRGVRLMEGKNGHYLSMPGYRLAGDGWQDNCYGLSKEFQAKMLGTVVNAYEQTLAQTQATVQRQEGQESQAGETGQPRQEAAEAPAYETPAYDAGMQGLAM